MVGWQLSRLCSGILIIGGAGGVGKRMVGIKAFYTQTFKGIFHPGFKIICNLGSNELILHGKNAY